MPPPIWHASVELIRAMQGITPTWLGLPKGEIARRPPEHQYSACSTNTRSSGVYSSDTIIRACEVEKRGFKPIHCNEQRQLVTCPQCLKIMFNVIHPVRRDFLLERGDIAHWLEAEPEGTITAFSGFKGYPP